MIIFPVFIFYSKKFLFRKIYKSLPYYIFFIYLYAYKKKLYYAIHLSNIFINYNLFSPMAYTSQLNESSQLNLFVITNTAPEGTPYKHLPNVQFINEANITQTHTSPTSKYFNGVFHVDTILQPPYKDPNSMDGSIYGMLEQYPKNYSIICSYLKKDDEMFKLTSEIQSPAPDFIPKVTFFAPTNDAFEKLDPEIKNQLDSNSDYLKFFLKNHLIDESNGISTRTPCASYFTELIYHSQAGVENFENFYDDSTNPNGFANISLLNSLNIALNFTKEVKKSKEFYYINSCQLVDANQNAFNGVVHGISSCILLPDETIPSILRNPIVPTTMTTVNEALSYSLISQIMDASYPLNATLAQNGTFTFFAPTDKAIQAALQDGKFGSYSNIESLLNDKEICKAIVKAHTINGSYYFSTDESSNPPDPFASNFVFDFTQPLWALDGSRKSVYKKLMGTFTRGRTQDVEIYIDNARIYQCTNGTGFGSSCASFPTVSNTFAVVPPFQNVIHVVDEILFSSSSTSSLADLLQQDQDLSSFYADFKNTDLIHVLDAPSTSLPLTLFAPNNAAYNLLQKYEWMKNDMETLKEILNYHIYETDNDHVPLLFDRWLNYTGVNPPFQMTVKSFDAMTRVSISTTEASTTSSQNTTIKINFGTIIETNIASNGILYKIDDILLPTMIDILYASGYTEMANNFNNEEDLVTELNQNVNYTILAISDDLLQDSTFSSKEQLSYHVVTQSLNLTDSIDDLNYSKEEFQNLATLNANHMIAIQPTENLPLNKVYNTSSSNLYCASNGSLDISRSFRALNGNIQAINTILSPPTSTIYDTLENLEHVSIFTGFIKQQSDIVNMLKSPSEKGITLFIPSDNIMKQIFELDKIKEDTKQTKNLVNYHIVNGYMYTTILANIPAEFNNERYCSGKTLRTKMEGKEIFPQIAGEKEFYISELEEAFTGRLIQSDINADNGVIHVIDGILTYPGYTRP